MINPTKYVRKGIIDALKASVTTNVWEELVPKNVIPIPNNYILLTSPTLQADILSKNDYEWLSTINIDIYSVSPQGYVSGVILDDMVEGVLNAMAELTVPVFNIPKNNQRLVNMQPFSPLQVETASIQRRVLTYEFWLNRI